MAATDTFHELTQINKAYYEFYNQYATQPLWQNADVTDPKTIFDFKTFLSWFTVELLPRYAGKTDEELLRLSTEIVIYMNDSMCFIESSKPCYYMLKRHPMHEQNYWCPVAEEDFKKIFKAYIINLPVIKKEKRAKGEFKEVITTAAKNLYDIYSVSPFRRKHSDIVFRPNEGVNSKTDPKYLNMWMGYRYTTEQIESAIHDEVAVATCMDFLKFMYVVHCAASMTLFRYVMDWFATKTREPGTKMSTTICFYSKKQRVGKGFTINMIGRIFGQHYAQTNHPQDVVGRFTTMVDNLVLLFLDEAFFSGDKGQGQRIKGLVTEKHSRQERKYGDAKVIESATSYIFATNDTGVVPSDANDKRHFILESREDYASNDAYFEDFAKRMHANDDAAIRVLAWILLKGWKISPSFGKSGQNAPTTNMMLVQRENNYTHEEGFIATILRRGWILEPESYIDNVPFTGDATKDQCHIWNFHPGAPVNVRKRVLRTFEDNQVLYDNLFRFDDKGNPKNNLVRDSRINPYERDAVPKRSWPRVICSEDLYYAYQRWCKSMGINNRYARVTNPELLVKTVCQFLFFQDNPTLRDGQHNMPMFIPVKGILSYTKRDDGTSETRPVKIRSLTYYYLPPLAQCRNRFQSEVGAVFANMMQAYLTKKVDLDTSLEDEQEDIRRYMNLVPMITDYNKPWTLTKLDFGDFPRVEPAVNENGFRRRAKRKIIEIEDTIRPTGTRGTMEDGLEMVNVRKKRRLIESQPPPPPVEDVLNKAVYEIQDDDLAFLNGSVDDEIAQMLDPTVVESNNTNVFVDQSVLDDVFMYQPFGDEMFLFDN